jgi:hypothetical protein
MYNDKYVDIYMVERKFWQKCPICHGPLEEIYYGGGVTKLECNRCVKHFVTEIYNEKE